MDRSLKWRFIALLGVLVFCAATLASSVVGTSALPSWFNSLFSKKINLGLDLQGGMHIVYSIDLDKAVDDKATELKRDFEARFTEKGFKAIVKTPPLPLGGLTVIPEDPAKRAEIDAQLTADYGKDELSTRDCTPNDGSAALCYKVSSDFADSVKKSALANAVSTIRERINEKGVADPSVVEKGDDIIVELPGDPDDPVITETKDIIARTAKLEFKVVDDCSTPDPKGCKVTSPDHHGSPYMQALYKKVGSDKKGNATDPAALQDEIRAEVDNWKPEQSGAQHRDYYLFAYDRDESLPVAEAKIIGCLRRDSVVTNGKTQCAVTGRHVIDRYINGVVDKDGTVIRAGLVQADKSFKIPDDHQMGYELDEPQEGAKDQRKFWRTYYLERAVRLTGTAVSNAYGNYDPSTNKPVVLIDFNRYGGRVFGDITTEIVGMKLATILDDKVKSAPLINQAITGGRASITMGGSDPRLQEKERDDLVNVLKTGSLPAPLHEESENKLGPTLGADSIEKTKLSFAIGIIARRHHHDRHLPLVRLDLGVRGRVPHPDDARGDGDLRRDADLARHRGDRAVDRHGGRRQHPDLRAHPRRAHARQERARRDRPRVLARVQRDPRRSAHHRRRGLGPPAVRLRPDQGLRRHAPRRRVHDAHHQHLGHPHLLRLDGR